MFRRYDWECQCCGSVFERIVQFPQDDPAPKTLGEVEDDFECLSCPACGHVAPDAQRLISCPAEYHGERQLNPIVRGGQFDTMGMKQCRKPKELGELPDHATYEQARDYVRRPEYQEWRRERKAVRAENAAKRKRAEAIARGDNVNMRRDRCPGDPKITA